MEKPQTGIIEANIGKKSFSFQFDKDSTLGELYDAVSIVKNYIVERINNGDTVLRKEDMNSK